MGSAAGPMRVEVHSDVVCPWCAIGLRRLQAAREAYDGELEVVWRPFQLDPGAPAHSRPTIERLRAKFGAGAEAMMARVGEAGREEGIDMRFDIAQGGNTLDAHRVLWLAAREGVQEAAVERLLLAHFSEGRDIVNHESLADLAAEAGLERGRVAAMLASDEGRAEVLAEIEHGRRAGVTAVPTFVLEGRWAVSGAQRAETLLEAFAHVERATAG